MMQPIIIHLLNNIWSLIVDFRQFADFFSYFKKMFQTLIIKKLDFYIHTCSKD